MKVEIHYYVMEIFGYQMEQYLKVTKFVFVPRLEELFILGDKIIKVEHTDVSLR
jgi:hypothetical protein